MMAHSGYPPPSATQLVAPPAPMGTSASLRGTPAPAMPAFVQAAIVAARIDKSVSTQVTMSAAVGPTPAPSGSAPAPAQPPLVRAALEAARQARSEARTVQNAQASSDRFGLLPSWEQEAELLRSMQLAGRLGSRRRTSLRHRMLPSRRPQWMRQAPLPLLRLLLSARPCPSSPPLPFRACRTCKRSSRTSTASLRNFRGSDGAQHVLVPELSVAVERGEEVRTAWRVQA